jgi:hypothetical protein
MTLVQKFSHPHYVSPDSIGYRAYVNALIQFNAALQRRLISYLETELPHGQQQPYAALTTGSDGRLEKGPESLVEIIILQSRNSFEGTLQHQFSQATRSYAGRMVFSLEDLEVKDLSVDTPLSYFHGSPQRVFPSRMIDSVLLYGCPELHERAMQRLAEEFIGSEGKRIVEITKDRRREYKVIMRTGVQIFKGSQIVHFGLEDGVSHYEPTQGFTGFKYGHLRYIQFSLTEDILRYIRSTRHGEILRDMPNSTQDRILYAQAERITPLTIGETEDLIDNYAYFLWMLHRQQEQYKARKETSLAFDTAEVKARTKAVESILGRKKIIQ